MQNTSHNHHPNHHNNNNIQTMAISLSSDNNSYNFEVSKNDVLLEPSSSFCLAAVEKYSSSSGDDKDGVMLVGNNRFRILIDMNHKAYREATTEEERKAVVSKIIDIICHQFSPEGRFLERRPTPIDRDNALAREEEQEKEDDDDNDKVENTAATASDTDDNNDLDKKKSEGIWKYHWRKLDLDETFYRVEQALQAGVTMDYPKSSDADDAVSGDGSADVNHEDEVKSCESSSPPLESPPESPRAASYYDDATEGGRDPPQPQQRRRSSIVSIAENAIASVTRVYQRRRSSAVDLTATSDRRRRRRSSTIGSITESILVALLGSEAGRKNGSNQSNSNNTSTNTNNTNATSSSKDPGKRRKKHLIEENYDDILDELVLPLQSTTTNHTRGQKVLRDLEQEDVLDYVGGSARDILHHHTHEFQDDESVPENFAQDHDPLDVILNYDGAQLDPRCSNPGNCRLTILMDHQQGSFGKMSPMEQRKLAAELVETVQNHWSGRFLKSGIRKDHPYLVLTTSQAQLALHALLLKRSRKQLMSASAATVAGNTATLLPALEEYDDEESGTFTSKTATGSVDLSCSQEPFSLGDAALLPPALAAATSAASTTTTKSAVVMPDFDTLQRDAIQTLQARKQRSVRRQKINRNGNGNPSF
jgi:hypothetical protein